MKVSKEQRSVLVWLLPFWSQWMAVCAPHLPIPLGSCQGGASVSVRLNYRSSANRTSRAVVLMMPVWEWSRVVKPYVSGRCCAHVGVQ